MKQVEHQLRVNVKSLASEARIIRQEMRKTTDKGIKEALAWHRAYRVRPEARLACLALAYVRGVPYKVCEPTTHSPVKVMVLEKKLARFGVHPRPGEVDRWLK